jgi:hypothetical protein
LSNSRTADNETSPVSNDELGTVNRFDSIITTDRITSREEMLLEDALTEADDYGFTANKREILEQDDVFSSQFINYAGRERRKKLDQEIEALYVRVAKELSDNAKDVMFALERLKKAQGIVIEDMRQYEEALYWVAQVKNMLVKKHNLRRYSYSWGMFIFLYGLIWLAALIAGFFTDIGISETGGWFSALAGGIGGVVTILYNLSWQVSVRQEFDRQHIMKYLIQPIMGVGLGTVIFFITSAGFLVINSGELGGDDPVNLGGPQLMVFQILLGFMAGFGQQFVYVAIDGIIQRLSPSKATK